MRKLLNVAVRAKNWGKHNTASTLTHATNNDCYAQVIGLELRDESEAISVGRYLSYNFQFTAADLLLPLPRLV